MPDISIVLPCYNAENTVEETLDSLARQTLDDFEVIAVDDGSEDSTLRILETWASEDSRFQVLACPHAGVIAAANAGIAACRGIQQEWPQG